MRCLGLCALGELAGTLDSISPFLVAAVVALVLASAWGDVSKFFKSRMAEQKQVQDLRPQVVDSKARWHSSQPPPEE